MNQFKISPHTWFLNDERGLWDRAACKSRDKWDTEPDLWLQCDDSWCACRNTSIAQVSTSQHLYNPSLQSQEVNTESTTRSTYLYNLIQTHSRFSPATSLRWPRHHGHQSATQAPTTIDLNKITTQYDTHTYIYKYYISPEIAAWSVDLKYTHEP